MANFLAALGQATPALNQTWQGILKEKRDSETAALEREKFGLEKEKFALEQQGVQTQQAISQENLEKLRADRMQKQKEQEMKDKPINLKTILSGMKLIPEVEDDIVQQSAPFGIDPKTGIGRTEDVQKFYTDYLLKGETSKMAISKQIVHTQKVYDNARVKYQQALDKGEDPAKLRELKTAMDSADAELSKWDTFNKGVVTAREGRTSLMSIIDKYKQEGVWNKLDDLTRVGLEAAADQGNLAQFNAIVGKAQVAETAESTANVKAETQRVRDEQRAFMEQQRIDAMNRRIDNMQKTGEMKISPADKIILTKGISSLSKERPEAEKSIGHINNLDQAIALAQKPGVTGKGGFYKSMLSPMMQAVGIRTQGMDDAETYQRFVDVIKSPMRLEMIGGGQVTEMEQIWLRQMAGGGGVGQAAALNLFRSFRKKAVDKIKFYNQNVGRLDKKFPESDIGSIYAPIDLPVTAEGKSETPSGSPTKALPKF